MFIENHQFRINEFMRKAGQELPPSPCIPSEEIRLLRAKLILEEAFETVAGLGVAVMLRLEQAKIINDGEVPCQQVLFADCELIISGECDILEVADGCADISVVTIGTLSAFGIRADSVVAEVDCANLRKFGPGGYRREDGKWIKPSNWQPPNILRQLQLQGYTPTEENGSSSEAVN